MTDQEKERWIPLDLIPQGGYKEDYEIESCIFDPHSTVVIKLGIYNKENILSVSITFRGVIMFKHLPCAWLYCFDDADYDIEDETNPHKFREGIYEIKNSSYIRHYAKSLSLLANRELNFNCQCNTGESQS